MRRSAQNRLASLWYHPRVEPEIFVYPPYEQPLVEAWGRRFECAFVVLHPFVRVPLEQSWSAARQHLDDATILSEGAKCSWAEVSSSSGLRSCASINQALLTTLGALDPMLADPMGSNALQALIQSEPVWPPTEGRFEPLLRGDFLSVFERAGFSELLHVPEFPQSDPVTRLRIDALRNGQTPFPAGGTLLAPDGSFLFTVDWDSFFTLFYGSHAFVDAAVRALSLEGFYATANTFHAWFNYSMGCATVTLSPEHWPGT